MSLPPLPPDGSEQLKPLQELPLPDAVSYVPQTMGWLVVAAVLACCIYVGIRNSVKKSKRQQYRQVALAELAAIRNTISGSALNDADRANALAAIPPLLKRTSLAAAPREQVASLSGETWLAFLRRTHGRFDARSGALLLMASYAPSAEIALVSKDEAMLLIDHSRDWIEHHHVEV